MRLPCRELSLHRHTHHALCPELPYLGCCSSGQVGTWPDLRCSHRSEDRGHKTRTPAARNRWHWGSHPGSRALQARTRGLGGCAPCRGKLPTSSSPTSPPLPPVPSSLPLTSLAGAVRAPRQHGTGPAPFWGWWHCRCLVMVPVQGSEHRDQGDQGVHSASTVKTQGRTMRWGCGPVVSLSPARSKSHPLHRPLGVPQASHLGRQP